MKILRLLFTICFIAITFSGCGGEGENEQPDLDTVIINSLTSSSSELFAGEQVLVSVTANGGDHTGLSFNWSTSCNGDFDHAEQSETSFTASFESISETCTVKVIVSSSTQTTSADLELSISAGNFAPVVIDSYQSSTTAEKNEELIFRIAVEDERPHTLRFEWQTSAGTLGTQTVEANSDTATSEITLVTTQCSDESTLVNVTIFDDMEEQVSLQFTPVATLNCSTSAIVPEISVTRTFGEAPFHVYVSASNTTATNISHPFDQIDYQWNFGVADSVPNFTNPVTNDIVNANNQQVGPEAAFVYNTPGTYTITLTASHQGDTVQTSIEVNVVSWSGETRYFDPVNGNDLNDGSSESSPKQSWQAIIDWLTAGDHRQALIKRSTTMPVNQELFLSNSKIRIASYGSGARPRLLATNSINYFVRLSPNDVMSEILFNELEFNGNNGNATSLVYATLLDNSQYLTHVSYLNLLMVNDDPHELNEIGEEIIRAKNHIMMQNYNGAGNISDVLVWNSRFERNHGFKNGIYAEIKDRLAVVASSFSGGDGNNIKDHPIYPANVDHALFRWNDFQATYSNNFSINNAAKSNKTVRFSLFDGNNFTGGSNGIDLTKHTDTAIGWFSDVIIQNNAFHDLGHPSQGYAIMGGSLERISIRDNLFYCNPQTDILVDEDGKDVSLEIYRNKFWKGADDPNTLPMLDFKNIAELTMSDNVFVNEGNSGGSTLILSFIIPSNNNWFIDNNQYWAPSIAKPFKLPGVDNYSFEQWQQATSFDMNSVNQDPEFVDPANGEF